MQKLNISSFAAVVLTLLVIVINRVNPQIVTKPERPICVPIGTCITGRSTGGIDVRVTLPNNGRCPSGKEVCNQLPAAKQCSYNFNRSQSTADGLAPYGSHPWLVYIANQTGYTGSGVLLDRYHVLTAAHKVYRNKNSLQRLEIYVGVYDATSLSTAYKRVIQDMIVHPNFDPVTMKNDLAVLRLKAHIPIGYQKNVGTACLPRPNARFTRQRCMVAGWGLRAFAATEPANFLRQVTVPIVPYETCRNSMSSVLGGRPDIYLDKDGEICAGGEAGKDACTDDGGAPLICRDARGRKVIAGLVIWGKKCGRPNVYGVYADVPKYVDWINRAIQNLRA